MDDELSVVLDTNIFVSGTSFRVVGLPRFSMRGDRDAFPYSHRLSNWLNWSIPFVDWYSPANTELTTK
jgi:hypothetical protein